MDNELDARLRRLEAGQAGQTEQLSRLAEEVEGVRLMLEQLVQLMREPDEDAIKLHDVLAALVNVIAVNTATLRVMERSLTGRAGQELDGPH